MSSNSSQDVIKSSDTDLSLAKTLIDEIEKIHILSFLVAGPSDFLFPARA